MSELEKGLLIGELAKAAGVTPEVVRYYEREGVIPRAPRQRGGYRVYTHADADRLRFIRRGRELGFALDEIRELLSIAQGDQSRSCRDVDILARSHIAQIEAKVAQLNAMRRELTRLSKACKGGTTVPDCSLLAAMSH